MNVPKSTGDCGWVFMAINLNMRRCSCMHAVRVCCARGSPAATAPTRPGLALQVREDAFLAGCYRGSRLHASQCVSTHTLCAPFVSARLFTCWGSASVRIVGVPSCVGGYPHLWEICSHICMRTCASVCPSVPVSLGKCR